MEKQARIYLAGHTGLVGRALAFELKQQGYANCLTRTHQELDLTRQSEVESFFAKEIPDYVILAAARVGGIGANTSFPAEFIYENLAIQNNVIHSAHIAGVKKLLFFGSACMYPRNCVQPMKEEHLLSGYLEPTNEAYALAKLSGLKMCQAYGQQYQKNFICAIPSNIYGPYDHFGSHGSHVIPALIDKFNQAKISKLDSVTIWGSGNPKREFIFSGDLAEAAIFLINNYQIQAAINIGSGEVVSIKELAMMIKTVVGYEGEFVFDSSKPDGAPEKLLDNRKIRRLGWRPRTSLQEGINKTYAWYQSKFKRPKNKLEAVSQ